MIKAIINHHNRGMISSINAFPLYVSAISDPVLSNIIYRIFVFNLSYIIMPHLLYSFIFWMGLDLAFVVWAYYSIMSVVSGLFHALHYFDILQIISQNTQNTQTTQKTESKFSLIDKLSITLTMMIYQFTIHLSTNLIQYLLQDKWYYLMIFIKYIVIVIYHALYCYNNVWHTMNIDIERRIDILEKMWPYYFGYTSLVTIAYFNTNIPIVSALYNILLIVALSNPFLIKVRFPSHRKYFSINLSIFTYIINCIVTLTKIIVELL